MADDKKKRDEKKNPWWEYVEGKEGRAAEEGKKGPQPGEVPAGPEIATHTPPTVKMPGQSGGTEPTLLGQGFTATPPPAGTMGVAPPTQPYAPFYPVPGVAQSPTGPMSAFAATTPPTMAVPGLEPLPVMPVPGPGATPEEMAHYQRLQLAELGPGAAFTPGTHNLGLLLDVPVPITVVAGRAVMRIQEVLGLQHGSVVPLDRNVEEPVDLLIKDKLIAQGELVVIDEKFFGIKITKIVEPEQRVKDLG